MLTVNIAYLPYLTLIQIFHKRVSIANKTIFEKLCALRTSNKSMFENLYAISHGLLAALFTHLACEKGIQLFLCIIYLSFIFIPVPRSKEPSPDFASNINPSCPNPGRREKIKFLFSQFFVVPQKVL